MQVHLIKAKKTSHFIRYQYAKKTKQMIIAGLLLSDAQRCGCIAWHSATLCSGVVNLVYLHLRNWRLYITSNA